MKTHLRGELSTALTDRERQVLDLLPEDLSNREIAERLGCAVKTVEAHISSALRKTGIRSRVGLALWWGPQKS